MKTYVRIFTLLALLVVIGFSSCTNDDITIDYTTNFKINPSGVISPFTFEIVSGELQSFGTNYKLRTHLLVYDSNGNLVKEGSQFLTNYQSTSNISLGIPSGNYTAIAITDVVKSDGSNITFRYWNLEDSTSLSTTKIVDNGYTGGKYKILGVKKTSFTVNGTKTGDISIAVEPAGALICTIYNNIHTYSDITYLGLKESKTSQSCLFDGQGTLLYNEENHGGAYDWWTDFLDVTDADYSSFDILYNYFYIFPSTNLNFKYVAVTGNNVYVDEASSSFYALSNALTFSPKAGDQYLFSMNLGDAANNYDISYGLVNGSSSTKSKALPSLPDASLEKPNGDFNLLYLKDIK